MSWIDLLLLVLASFRLTHLIVFDTITEPLRRPLENARFIGALITCHWCTGVWISAGAVLSYLQWPEIVRPVLLIFAVAGGQALVERWVEKK